MEIRQLLRGPRGVGVLFSVGLVLACLHCGAGGRVGLEVLLGRGREEGEN